MSVIMAQSVFVNSVFTVKPVFLNSMGLRVFLKSKVYQFFVNLENEIILCIDTTGLYPNLIEILHCSSYS